jgi:hypothetical protein
MSKEIISKIETKISELENKVTQNNTIVGNLSMSIESQSLEKTRVQTESTFLSGAIQAFKTMIAEIQTSGSEKSFEKIEELN